MPRDYARKSSKPTAKRSSRRGSNTRKQPAQSRIPPWLWLFTGGVTGAFVMFLLHLGGVTPAPSNTPDAKPATKSTETTKPKQPEQEPEPRLQFYQLLKESTVEVPDVPAGNGTDAPQKDLLYVLQAGSFRDDNDANRMRAELILLNLDAQVEAVSLDNGDVWHRVVVGPFESRSQMAKARSVLVSNDINPLLLKRAKDS